MTKLIGTLLDRKLNLVISKKFQLIFTFGIMGISSESDQSIFNQLLWNELAMCSGVQLERVNHTEPGTKQDSMLTLKIRAPNFGVATEVISTLLLMNFEVVSTSPTCYDGLIDILSAWKLKEALSPYSQQQFGSHQTWTQGNGIQNATKKPWKL